MKELKILARYTTNSFQLVFTGTGIFIFFLISKLLRIGLFLGFLTFLLKGTNGVGGFNPAQMIFFYLSFNLIDTLAQLLFREVYRFRALVISGGLDQILVKPVHPLIRVLLGGPDVIDLAMMVLLTGFTVWYAQSNFHPGLQQWLLYILLAINGIIISAAFHITVLGLGVITTSVDHLVMIYRDLTSLMRIPVDLYIEPVRTLLTFLIPLGIMLTFPPKALLNLLSWQMVLLALLISSLAFFLAMKFWNYSLRHYQSASS